MLEIVALAGATEWRMVRELQVTNADRDEAAAAIPASAAQRLVIVNRGSGDPRRSWPVEHFAAGHGARIVPFDRLTIGYRSHGRPASTPRPARPARSPSSACPRTFGIPEAAMALLVERRRVRRSALLNCTTLDYIETGGTTLHAVSLHNSSRRSGSSVRPSHRSRAERPC